VAATCRSRTGKEGKDHNEAGGPGEEAAARGRVRAGGARPGKGGAHGGNPAGGPAHATTNDHSTASVRERRGRALVPGACVRVPRSYRRAGRARRRRDRLYDGRVR